MSSSEAVAELVDVAAVRFAEHVAAGDHRTAEAWAQIGFAASLLDGNQEEADR